MKKKLLIIFSLFSTFVFSQEENVKRNPISLPSNIISIYGIQYNNMGDNFLSEAHKGNIGFGSQVNLISLYGFSLGGVVEFSSFQVSNKSLAGNIKKTNYTNFLGRISYNIGLSDKFSLVPYMGIGEIKLRQKTGKKDFGSFRGTAYHLGLNLNYNIEKRVFFFTGLNYNYATYDINSNPEYQSFFDRSNQIQIHLGFGF